MTRLSVYYTAEPEDGLVLADEAAVREFVERLRLDSVAYGVGLMSLWYVDGDVATPEFGVGVNGGVGVLSYSGREWPGLWASHDGTASTSAVLDYDHMGSAVEVLANSQIPYPAVLEAAVGFFRSRGDRPASVRWQREGAD
ncbi:hypothetical protein JOD54_000555 [Actinokineospora baliensis]|uniref:Imm1 family immunity protein n=1 Tax=Actinokineospora baliensis TaxID=547056 RepID=UPI0019595E50|nr:Imm1 family immunity protein [Actinokineospora baliensis]MBM7770351.1 hypothetical protein [Actinokineospora baliensis]